MGPAWWLQQPGWAGSCAGQWLQHMQQAAGMLLLHRARSSAAAAAASPPRRPCGRLSLPSRLLRGRRRASPLRSATRGLWAGASSSGPGVGVACLCAAWQMDSARAAACCSPCVGELGRDALTRPPARCCPAQAAGAASQRMQRQRPGRAAGLQQPCSTCKMRRRRRGSSGSSGSTRGRSQPGWRSQQLGMMRRRCRWTRRHLLLRLLALLHRGAAGRAGSTGCGPAAARAGLSRRAAYDEHGCGGVAACGRTVGGSE
jgi:hypothetical protein